MKRDKIKNAWQEGFYKDIEKRPDKIFREVSTGFSEFLKLLKKIKAKNVLDLGCGTGKHAVALAKNRFKVYGIDLVDAALKVAQKWLAQEGVEADLAVGNIYKKLPYDNNFFNGVISTKAMHHARVFQIKKLIKELERIMRPGGILMVEVPKRHRESWHLKRQYKKIEPGTIIPLEGQERGVPHHIFVSKKELAALFPNFQILDIRVNQGSTKHRTSSHYTMLGRLK